MDQIISRLQQLVIEVPQKLTQFLPEEMSVRPDVGKWSKKEILGHLCDSALYNWHRFNAAQYQDGPLEITSYPQDALVHQNDYQNLPTGNILTLWKSVNQQIIAVLKNLSVFKYAHPVRFSNGETKDLQFLVEDYLRHLEHHLLQLFGQKNELPILPERWNISVKSALQKLSEHPEVKEFVTLLENGRMYVEIYQPNKIDLQTPHDQDEIYVVIAGSGMFFNNGDREPFHAGDVIFVPAGIEHRFEDFTDDFKTWVIFY